VFFVLVPLGHFLALADGQTAELTDPEETRLIDELSFNEQGLSFRLSIPALHFDDKGNLTGEGLNGRTQEPGAPSVPFYSTWIVLPPYSGLQVKLSEPDWNTTRDVELQPSDDVEFSGQSLTSGFDAPAVSEDALLERANLVPIDQEAYYPQRLYEISEISYVRDIRLANLSIYPVRYNPAQSQLLAAESIDVEVLFDDIDGAIPGQLPSYRDMHGKALSTSVLNWEQGKEWRSIPEESRSSNTQLPIGVDVYKIEVDQDAIYQISYSDLQNAGMDVDGVDPNTLQMLHRGQPVAIRFFGNDDTVFQPNEYLLFYGWAFDGPRLEEQFILNNVFWIWAGGTPSYISEVASQSGSPVDSVRATVTREPENVWFPSWTDQWDYFPNEPDAWYWDRYGKSGTEPITRTYALTLHHPTPDSSDATFTAEFSSKHSPFLDSNPVPHKVRVYLNDSEEFGTQEWYGIRNINVTATVPVSSLQNGLNHFDVVIATEAPINWRNAGVYLNRLTVDYRQELAAVSDQLIFRDDGGSPREFGVRDFSTGAMSDILIWEISDRLAPSSILSDSIEITGAGPYTFTFGTGNPASSHFIATTLANIESPLTISRYVPEDLVPEGSGADWVAITSRDFITEVERLARHREETFFGTLSTHLVDVESVVNQYGYGLPMPSSIQDYLKSALVDWQRPPSYALLVGDSTVNPRNNRIFGNDFFAPQILPTDLTFVDRFNGQVPSDHVYSLLSGEDLLPDIAVGRIPVTSTLGLSAVINKIILYETNQLLPADWMENILFLSDKYSPSAGDFCQENSLVGEHLPSSFTSIELCADEMEPSILRTLFFSQTNITGTSIVNYRGHGSVVDWSSIINTSHVYSWTNEFKPVVILTGDCLDGFFALPSSEGLAETFLRATSRASAAHWSSSGLGFSAEHSTMVDAFYDGLFVAGQTAIGDATNYAKLRYFQDGGHESLLYSFILEGDPAMQLMRPSLSLEKNVFTDSAHRGDLIQFSVDITNSGIYPSYVVVSDTLPNGMSFVTATSSVSSTIVLTGSDIIFDLQFGSEPQNIGLPRDATASITITVQVDQTFGGGTLSNQAWVGGSGLEAWPGDESDSADVFIHYYYVFLPTLIGKNE
jgi:uncharacterized repeat protein (TIGR01451 family)